jgi:hypothetical protein
MPAGCLFPEYSFNDTEPNGSTSASTGGGSGGEMGNPENCTNGVDDDGDGAADCQDMKCGDHTCVTAVPMGWTGPFALYAGVPEDDPGCPPEFPSATPYLGKNDFLNTPAVCTCTCGPAQGQTCGTLDSIQISTGDKPCGMAPYCIGDFSAPPAGWDGSCHNDGFFAGGQTTCGVVGQGCSTQTGQPCMVSVTASGVNATGGTCSPNPVQIQTPEVLYATLGRACGDAPTTGAGCNVGQICLPRPAVPFEPGLCISSEGDVSCPAGPFTQRHVFYGDVMDDRSCMDDCSCGAASGGTCPTTITLYGSTQTGTCTGAVVSLPAGTCANLQNNPTLAGRTATQPGAPQGGTCTASGGIPTGGTTPISPTTFCCTP